MDWQNRSNGKLVPPCQFGLGVGRLHSIWLITLDLGDLSLWLSSTMVLEDLHQHRLPRSTGTMEPEQVSMIQPIENSLLLQKPVMCAWLLQERGSCMLYRWV